MSADPYSCPFCGKYGQEEQHLVSGFHVVCHPCGALGPQADSFEAAVQLWNRLCLSPRLTEDGWLMADMVGGNTPPLPRNIHLDIKGS